MSKPLNPPDAIGEGRPELPAYLSNGVIGLRVRPNPLLAGMALVSGFSGLHPERKIEAAANAPYPLAGDIALDGVWMSDAPTCCAAVTQAYDFSCGELTSRLRFEVGDIAADIKILTFCCRHQPTLLVQEIQIATNTACDMKLRAIVAAKDIPGKLLARTFSTPGEPGRNFDGSIAWQSLGGYAQCGIAYLTELLGAAGAEPKRSKTDLLRTEYGFRAKAGRTYRLRQIVSVVPSAMHDQPERHAERLVALGAKYGFDKLRAANKAEWDVLWKGRIALHGADRKWQALADAAFFYLNSSVHVSAPASTSIFGLATWHDYHYYYGHVMWDIETFALPPLTLLQPEAAEAIVEYRVRMMPAARATAQSFGRAGLQFPWESAPSSGYEAAPSPGTAAWHEDHVTLDVALALAQYAFATGDEDFLAEKAWPVVSGAARWIESRSHRSRTGYEFRRSMGIAERKQANDNDAFTMMAARKVLLIALEIAKLLGRKPRRNWERIAGNLIVPIRDGMVVPHADYRSNEEKGATPSPLMGAFPLWSEMFERDQKATFDFFLGRAKEYIGSPMLSPMYGVWAAWAGKRALSERLLEEGYAQFVHGRFMQTLEYRPDRFPEQPKAGPFFANLGGFLMTLVLGFPGLRIGSGTLESWPQRKVVLPRGWKAIEIERLWAQGRPVHLLAEQGARRAQLKPL
ncbi:MAG: glycoside hydrolase family 65 protein [Rhizomicrobium sp.]